jgi:hypothetical protein
MMLIMGVFSAALYLAHPELDRAQGVGLLTKLNTLSYVNFLSADSFICQGRDDNSLLVFHDTMVQTSFNVM